MVWHDHSDLKGKHAFLSPSKGAAFNDTPEELCNRYLSSWATTIGTLTHEFAEKQIIIFKEKISETDISVLKWHLVTNGVPLVVINSIDLEMIFKNVMAYVNDAIGFAMRAEQPLYYSDYCFGTADTICFRRNKLRIHDLKTGVTHVDPNQLMRYAALFCLEYKYKPEDISIELRIYQGCEVLVIEPTLEEMIITIDTIKNQSNTIQEFISGERT